MMDVHCNNGVIIMIPMVEMNQILKGSEKREEREEKGGARSETQTMAMRP